jgi:hypothetical protein
MRFVAIGVIHRSGLPADGNSAVTISKVEGVAGVREPRRFPERGGGTHCQQRVGDAASPPDICAFGDGIVSPRRDDPSQHHAGGSMQRCFNRC